MIDRSTANLCFDSRYGVLTKGLVMIHDRFITEDCTIFESGERERERNFKPVNGDNISTRESIPNSSRLFHLVSVIMGVKCCYLELLVHDRMENISTRNANSARECTAHKRKPFTPSQSQCPHEFTTTTDPRREPGFLGGT